MGGTDYGSLFMEQKNIHSILLVRDFYLTKYIKQKLLKLAKKNLV